jgi:hypothetical protein
MPVVVDHQPLSVDQLGLRTFGQVLAHLHRENRIVVRVLVDGQEPEGDRLSGLRQTPTDQHTIFVETAEPRAMVNEVLDEVHAQLDEAERLRADAVDQLLAGNHARAFERLSGCFGRWQHTQESVEKTIQLLRIDASRLSVQDAPLADFLRAFGDRLRMIKESLEDRDFVRLADVLQYELAEFTGKWKLAVEEIRRVAG